ncbi:MAG: SDR family NAD(P)-dependent oxidoreductase [Myxococcales bacterium]|nr:SDR family NAD(P)-dependent oxidoreductase [Myxococcales bacterium]
MHEDSNQRVALVAGATRGAGRGIALALAEAGLHVYCTGRSTRAAPRRRSEGSSPFALDERPEAIEDVADAIVARGGAATAVVVDHGDAAAVAELVDRIARERGRVDVLVHSLWAGDELAQWGTPLAELDVDRGWELLRRALYTHLLTCRHVAPLLREGGLIVEMTDGVGAYYRGGLFYDLAKMSVIRAAFCFAEELRPRGIAAVALTPGYLRSEAMLEHFGVTEERWRDGVATDPNFLFSESPALVGRAVAALATDPEVMRRSGRVLSSWGLARAYGLRDVDGSRPDWGAHAATQAFGAEQRESHHRFLECFEHD